MGKKILHQAHEQDETDLGILMKNAYNFVIYRLISDSEQPSMLRVKSVSPSIREIMGVSDPMNFEAWFKDIHSNDRARIDEAIMQAMEKGVFDEEFRIFHPKKMETRWVRAISTSI